VAGLRALRAATANLWLGVAMVPLSFVPCLGGAAVWGAQGFAGGMALSFGIYAIGGWLMLLRAAGRFAAGTGTGSGTGTAEVTPRMV
jgi:hypothetical protein